MLRLEAKKMTVDEFKTMISGETISHQKGKKMKTFVIEPKGWPCKLSELEAGLFLFEDELCLKTAYIAGEKSEAYLVDGGSTFWGGTNSVTDCEELIIQPVIAKWVEVEK